MKIDNGTPVDESYKLNEIGKIHVQTFVLPLTDMAKYDTLLLYKIKCNGCKNDDEWSEIRARTLYTAKFSISRKCENVTGRPDLIYCYNSVDQLSYPIYEWIGC